MRDERICTSVSRTDLRRYNPNWRPRISTLDRAVQSVLQARSDYFKLSILIVDYKGRSDVADYVGKLSSEGASISYTRSRDTGFRSTALWRGISVCNGDFVSHLDDTIRYSRATMINC